MPKAGAKTEWKWPLVLGAVAFIVRLIYLIEYSHAPEFALPMIDEKWHWEWAAQIVNQSFWGDTAYFRAPLYPYFLALLYWTSGASVFVAKLLQSILCFGTAIFIYRIADYLFNKKTAILSALIYAFYGTLVFYETMFLIPALFLFLTCWGMARYIIYLDSKSTGRWLLTGLIFGLAAIARPNILIVIPALMFWKFYVDGREKIRAGRILRPVVLLIGVLLAVAPVTVRNKIVTGEYILISSQGGINLYLGNNPEADGLTMLMPEIDLNESVSWRQFGQVTRAAAQAEAKRQLSDSDESAFWTAKAVSFITENPGKFMSLVWRKTVYLVSGFENSDNINIYYHRAKSNLYAALVWHKLLYFPFGLLLPLALGGIYLYRDRWRRLMPLYLFCLFYIPSIVLFLVTARHRLVLVPFLIMLAAAAIFKLIQSFKKSRIKEAMLAIAIVVTGLVLFNQTYYELHMSGQFQTRFNAGIAYERLGDYAAAEREYKVADSEYPNSASLIMNLAHSQYQQGKLNEAERNYQRALSIDPQMPLLLHNYALLKEKQNKPDSALMFYRAALERYDFEKGEQEYAAQSLLAIADLYERSGNAEQAVSAYQQALRYTEYYPGVWFKAAGYYARSGEYGRSDSLYAIGMTDNTASAGDWFNWGLSYLRRGELATGVEKMHRAIETDSTMFQAYYSLAAANLDMQAPTDSVRYYLDLSLRYNPNFAPALRMREQLP